jgi:hypothetical protein
MPELGKAANNFNKPDGLADSSPFFISPSKTAITTLPF